jgi:hypothetical protein
VLLLLVAHGSDFELEASLFYIIFLFSFVLGRKDPVRQAALDDHYDVGWTNEETQSESCCERKSESMPDLVLGYPWVQRLQTDGFQTYLVLSV